MVVKSVKKCPACGESLTVKVTTTNGKQWTQYVCEECGYSRMDKKIEVPKEIPHFEKPKPTIKIIPAKNTETLPIIQI